PCPWFDSESGHHYLKNPAYGWVFAFLRLYIPSLYSCFSLPWYPLVGPVNFVGRIRRSRHPACFPGRKAKNPAPYGTGFF
ncbi:hypothetical protein, partial [Enterobacter asburiae]|uniref:hypothetical protein n=1 Tax=Enterobacter asburiae TaxID=61645 RepID=UPI0019553BA7